MHPANSQQSMSAHPGTDAGPVMRIARLYDSFRLRPCGKPQRVRVTWARLAASMRSIRDLAAFWIGRVCGQSDSSTRLPAASPMETSNGSSRCNAGFRFRARRSTKIRKASRSVHHHFEAVHLGLGLGPIVKTQTRVLPLRKIWTTHGPRAGHRTFFDSLA